MDLFFWRNPIDTGPSAALRDWLSEEEWQAAVAQIGKRPIDLNGQERRDKGAPRHAVIRRCLLRVERRGQVLGMLLVRTRNLSSTGACVVHGGRIPKHSQATVVIETEAGDGVITTGKVVWCRRAKGVKPAVHEIGVAFDAPIDVSGFVSAEDGRDEMRVA